MSMPLLLGEGNFYFGQTFLLSGQSEAKLAISFSSPFLFAKYKDSLSLCSMV